MGKSNSRKKKSTANQTTNPPQSQTNANGIGALHHADPSAAEFLKRAHELKEEGNRLFQSKDYPGALDSYARALSLLPRDHPDRAVFHSNRAACLMQLRPVDHSAVAAECSLALQSQPLFPRALFRRARALLALRRPDLALHDVRSLLSVDPSNRDALDLYAKLKDEEHVAVKSTAIPQQQQRQRQPSPAALGASAVRGVPISGLGPCLPARPVHKKSNLPPPLLQPQQQSPKPKVVPSPPPPEVALKPKDEEEKKVERVEEKRRRMRPLKLVYDHDIRLAEMPEGCGFKVLREIVGKRFPCSKSVLVKYRDEDGDLVTVTSTRELRLAEASLDKGRMEGEVLGVLRLHVVEVSAEQEPALVEEEEVEENPVEEEGLAHSSIENESPSLQALETDQEVVEEDASPNEKEEEKEKEKEKVKENTVEKKECDHAECKEVEVDEWLYDFAQLFRQQVGVDPDAHLDLHELGMELCSEALEETVTGESAQNLFELAAAKFQEVAALAFFNWGNVHMCAARKKIPLDESAPKEVVAAQLRAAYDWVRERYALAGEKYEEALRIKSDFYEGLLALAQQHFETAKLHWSFALANKVDLTVWDSSETIWLFDSAEEKMKIATEMWEKVEEQRMNELKDPNSSKKEELVKKRKKQGAGVDGHGELSAEEAAEQAAVMRSQIHLFWGNMLFERSQVEYKLGVGDWKKNLDMSVEWFKLAGASDADISVVLKNHASNASGTSMECDEKNVTSLSNGASEQKPMTRTSMC